VAPARFLALGIEDKDFRRLNMAEKTEKQTEMISYQALEKGSAHKGSGIRMQRGEHRALTERRWN
jgi:hypothetical protein